jgi:pyridinium-3,5-bisthiocarboxylic acid mononucleotide nickel chelatase
MSCRSMAQPSLGMHLHLDPIGGLSGDMFAAALLDARPELESEVQEALQGLGLPAGISVTRLDGEDHHFRGSRLSIDGLERVHAPGHSAHDLILHLRESGLSPRVKERSLDMLGRLAAAEARVHGIPVEAVHFHEIASWDTLIDVAAAATLVEGLGVATASTAPLPLGRGRVQSDHGPLPVPAPAAAELLTGFEMIDDGIAGERITPTGAAILAHLQPAGRLPTAGKIRHVGVGFGTKRFPHIANMLRVLLLAGGNNGVRRDIVGMLRFEIDDQSGEDLAIGLEHIRASEAVLDVCSWPVMGKKGRHAVAVQVLCEPQALDEMAELCLRQTATIGLRTSLERRTVLEREAVQVESARGSLALKRVRRPGGQVTAKLEAEDVARLGDDAAARQRLRRRAEQQAEEDE